MLGTGGALEMIYLDSILQQNKKRCPNGAKKTATPEL